jgi:hypothetical protein
MGFGPRRAVRFALPSLLCGMESYPQHGVRSPKPQAPLVGSGSAGLGKGLGLA